MQECGTIRQAKDYLASGIAAEAEREGKPLSEIERKMLYFSETGWTLPDMAQVSAEFDRGYDQDEYEQKIAGLIRKLTAHHHSQNQDELAAWDEAVQKLSEGDHYLLVLISAARRAGKIRPPHDRLKLWLTAFSLVFGFFALTALLYRLFGPDFVERWVFGRNSLGRILIVAAVLICIFRSSVRDLLKSLFSRW